MLWVLGRIYQKYKMENLQNEKMREKSGFSYEGFVGVGEREEGQGDSNKETENNEREKKTKERGN